MSLVNKKVKFVFYDVIELVNEPDLKAQKSWVDQWKELYNRLMKKWIHDNDVFSY